MSSRKNDKAHATFQRTSRLINIRSNRVTVDVFRFFIKSTCILLFFLIFPYIKLSAQVKFIENRGQWPKKAYYKAALVNGNLWVTDSGLLFSLWDASASEKMHNRTLNRMTLDQHAFYLHFAGGDFSNITALNQQSPTTYNYFYGNDRSHWVSGLHSHGELLVKDLYEGVDLRIYSENGTLKYNLECSGKQAISHIRMQYIGVDALNISQSKIGIQTTVGEFTDAMPAVYAESVTGKTMLSATYVPNPDGIGFDVNAEHISSSDRIIIDPVLVFSTYTGSTADNFGCTGTYDDWGNGFAGGTVFSIGLPVTTGAFQTTFGGGTPENIGYGDGRDAAILKFSPDGTQVLYCTYIGGSDNEQPHSMVADASGNLYIMGSTRSADFPVTGGFDQSHNGDYDFFVCHLSSDGTQLMSSTYVGGSGLDAVGANREVESIDNFPLLYNYADEFRGEVITDGQNVFVCGVTYSINFPRSNNSGWFGGKEDACLFSLSGDLSTLNWCQLLGKEGHDAFYGIALGKHNDIYAAGGTTSSNLPSSFSAFRNTYAGGLADGMIARFNKTSGLLRSAAFNGTNAYEQAYFVQTDNSGNPYIYGQTEGAYPRLNAAYNQASTGQFIVRLDSSLNAVTLSTSFGAGGNNPNISPSAFLVDQCERIFVSGWGGEVNDHLIDVFTFRPKTHRNRGNTRSMPLTNDAQQKTTDGSDFYVAVFAKNMNTLLYATYFGGVGNGRTEANEHVDGGTSRFDKKGIIYQSVCAGCGRNGLFPTTAGAYSRTNNSNNCNNALFKIDFENLNRVPTMRDTFIEVMATDWIGLTMRATDPDVFDTVFLSWQYVKPPKGPAPFIQKGQGIGSATLSIPWITTCANASDDTVVLKVMVSDKGCPKSDTSYAYIRILIKPPPVIIPPESICVSFDRITGKLKVSWPATVQPDRFFSHFELRRINPDKSESVMDTFMSYAAGSFTDPSVTDPYSQDYCYYLTGVNICGVRVKAQLPFCTVRELNNPIEGVRLKYATVEEDKRVKVAWEASREPDFKEFEVYRFPRGQLPVKQPFAITTDTFIVDSGFDVDAISNCYMIIVTDQCGHVSDTSNRGCNVVISGSGVGKPWYYFDLNWQQYLGWKQGPDNWYLERQYSSNPWTGVTTTSTDRYARDGDLDYDWGGYWYRVTATEYTKGMNRMPETSQSNWIWLYQPPEVYVPSGITINGDQLNDVWGTVPVFVREYDMKVFNRWGQKVWESTDKKRQWDGTVNGVMAEDGVWAWSLTFRGWDDKTYHMTGTVTIIH